LEQLGCWLTPSCQTGRMPSSCIIPWDAVSLLLDVLSAFVLIERLSRGEHWRASYYIYQNMDVLAAVLIAHNFQICM